jgi:hypothetical protein
LFTAGCKSHSFLPGHRFNSFGALSSAAHPFEFRSLVRVIEVTGLPKRVGSRQRTNQHRGGNDYQFEHGISFQLDLRTWVAQSWKVWSGQASAYRQSSADKIVVHLLDFDADAHQFVQCSGCGRSRCT